MTERWRSTPNRSLRVNCQRSLTVRDGTEIWQIRSQIVPFLGPCLWILGYKGKAKNLCQSTVAFAELSSNPTPPTWVCWMKKARLTLWKRESEEVRKASVISISSMLFQHNHSAPKIDVCGILVWNMETVRVPFRERLDLLQGRLTEFLAMAYWMRRNKSRVLCLDQLLMD